MLWTACCLAFFSFLRVRELTVSGDTSFDSSVHMTREDLAVDHPSNPSVIWLRLKAFKDGPVEFLLQ